MLGLLSLYRFAHGRLDSRESTSAAQFQQFKAKRFESS